LLLLYFSVSCLPRCPVYTRQQNLCTFACIHGFCCTEQLCLPEKEEHINTQHVRHVLSSQQNHIGKNSLNN
jgi:hypothetical protein